MRDIYINAQYIILIKNIRHEEQIELFLRIQSHILPDGKTRICLIPEKTSPPKNV